MFKAEVLTFLRELFGAKQVKENYRFDEDSDGLYLIDAVITTKKKQTIAVELVPNSLEAERAVINKLRFESKMSTWGAIVEKREKLSQASFRRVEENFPFMRPNFDKSTKKAAQEMLEKIAA